MDERVKMWDGCLISWPRECQQSTLCPLPPTHQFWSLTPFLLTFSEPMLFGNRWCRWKGLLSQSHRIGAASNCQDRRKTMSWPTNTHWFSSSLCQFREEFPPLILPSSVLLRDRRRYHFSPRAYFTWQKLFKFIHCSSLYSHGFQYLSTCRYEP